MLIALFSAEGVVNVAKTILGIGGLIFVHELGHFLVGRWCGVHAEAFSIGFGPVIVKWYGKPTVDDRPDSRTEYRLSWIPLGGYVKFLGENPDERGERDPRSFHAASYPRKVLIMLAGVTMNVVAAFVLFATTFAIGWDRNPPVVGELTPGYPAWERGVKEGDEIVSIDGRRVLDFTDLKQDTAFAKEVDLEIRRDGRDIEMRLPTRDAGEGLHQIGVGPATSPDGRIGVDGDLAAKAGFKTGDRVVAVDGKPVAGFEEATKRHSDAKKDTVWTVERDGRRIDVTLPWRTVPHPKIDVLIATDSDEIVVRAGGPAAALGLASGDRPVSVGGVATPSAAMFEKRVADPSVAGAAVVRRGAREVSVPLPDAASRAAFASSIAHFPTGPIRTWLADGPGPARAAGLPDGAEIVEIDHKKPANAADVQAAVKLAFDERRAVPIAWRDLDGREGTVAVTPVDEPDPDFGGLGRLLETRLFREPNPVAAAALAAGRCERWVERILGTLASVFSGGVSGSKLSGPIVIAKATYASAERSWSDLLMFLGMISMNLAVLNVVPLPLLDGGQLAVHTIERIRGRPLPERVLEGIQWTGLVLLLCLMAYVIRNDIIHL